MKYFKVFNTEAEYLEYAASYNFLTPNVSTLRDCTHTWITAEQHSFSEDYFTIESLEDDNTIRMTRYVTNNADMGVYSLSVSTDDGETWSSPIEVPHDGEPYEIVTLNTGDRALLKYESGVLSLDTGNYANITSDGEFNVYGNAMSLRTDDFVGDTSSKNFSGLLKGSKVISARDLVLPSSTVGADGYVAMFSGCTSLTTAPKLSATTLGNTSYRQMFKGCSSLTAAPILPATRVYAGTYTEMFSGCTSLTTAPELPATTLGSSCYREMFGGCTNLVTPPSVLPASAVSEHAYRSMFVRCSSLTATPTIMASTISNSGCCYMYLECTSLTTVPTLSATTTGYDAYRGMFADCTSLTTIPSNVIRAASLPSSCCHVMFSGCTSLATVPVDMLQSTTMGPNAYKEMFYGCTSLTNAPKLPAMSLNNYCYNSMFGGCTALTTVQSDMLPAETLVTGCYQNMFSGCTSLTTTPILSSTTLANACYNGMFNNCTSLIETPELPATTLADSCYRGMFNNCTSLTTITSNIAALTIPQNACNSMFHTCTSLQSTPQIAATTVDASGCYNMFRQCTSLTAATELHASSVGDSGFRGMFYGCRNLVTAPSVISASTVGNSGCNEMFKSCASLTTAPEISATTLGVSAFTCMFQDCTSLTTAPSQLPAMTLSESCYNTMFRNCSAMTTVQSDMLPATTLAKNCYRSMFYDCQHLTASPTLQAQTLEEGCYNSMFRSCHALNDITCYATDISASDSTTNWTYQVNDTGVFTKRNGMSAWTTGVNGIPENWDVRDDTYVTVTGVTISASAATVNKGNTYILTASVLPSDADDQVVSWSTSDNSVATVSDGVVTGVGCGDAIITVTTHEGSYTATCDMSVENHVTSADLNTYILDIISGDTYRLIPTVTPSDACNTAVTWSSSDSAIATVDATGLVSGVTPGSATVTVTSVDNSSATKNCAVTVAEPQHATGVTLSESAITITENSRHTLTATVEPNNAVDKRVTWTSSDSNIATVDSNGVVSGVTSGRVTITVTTVDGGYTDSCDVTVEEATFTAMTIGGASAVSAETCQYRAICDNVEDVTSSATWSITAGSQYATINQNNGQVTVLNGANGSSVTIQAEYAGLTATTTVTLTYLSGATSETTSVITTDVGGNSTSVVTTVTEYEDGSSTETIETVVTDIDGELVGSSETTKNINSDDSYNEATINYDENGDPTNGINITGDTDGNVSTQTVEYDDNGNAVVTGYEIDTSESESGKTFNSGGTNTEYYAFDLTHGFTLDFDFTIDFANQPPGQSDGHHNILTAKRADPSPWYGFQLRHSGTNKYIQLGTQFASGGNTNTTINPLTITGNVGTYKLRIMYDPTSTGTTFTCIDTYNQSTLYSSNLLFPDIEELKYLKITIGNATDSSGNPFRYSNITVTKFELKKLKYVANPTIVYQNGTAVINCITTGADLYYRLNLSGSYSAYTTPITITADTVVQAYATYSGDTSDIVREDFEMVDVTGVTLSDNSITIVQGRTYTLTATVLPSDALDKSVTWSSSDSNVASVDSNGVISGVASGSATVTVTTHDGGYTAQCSVSVSASPYTELEYIESTSSGGQYIDLDIKLYETLGAWYDIAIKYNVSGAGKNPEQPTLFGCQKNVSPYPGTFIRMNQNDSTNTIGRYIGGTKKDNTLGNNNTDIELPVQTAPNRNVTNLNNSNQTHSWGTSLFCAFSDENNTPSRFIAAKLYYFKLFSKTSGTSQGTLIRDMMPCKRNSDNAIGLLDKVNNVFYTNPSGDAFVAGPVVS